LLSYPHVVPHGRIYKARGAPLQNDRSHYSAIHLNSPRSRFRELPCNPLHKASSPGRRVLRISKRPEPVNTVHRPSCIWHEPFCYSRRHRPTPKNTSRGNPGCAVGPKTPTGYKYPQPPHIQVIQVFHLPTTYKSSSIQF
jgi:hypothetical protein